MTTLSENLVNILNQSHFYKEFSFAKNEFFPEPGSEQQFADHVVWLRDVLIIYQIKERASRDSSSIESERTWFRKKVLGLGKKQIKDSLAFLRRCPNIRIVNQRRDVFDINTPDIKRIFSVVIYQTPNALPLDCLAKKFVISSSAGLVHVFSWTDYLMVLDTLITPGEFIEYLTCRKDILEQYRLQEQITEKNALGRYLRLEPSRAVTGYDIDEDFSQHVDRLISDVGKFDISYLLDNLRNNIEESESNLEEKTDYYYVLVELVKLGRSELVAAKKRIAKCLEAVMSGSLELPYRFTSASSNCGFLFLPIQLCSISEETKLLTNLTYMSKYEQKLQRHVGISFAKRDPNTIYIRWVLVDSPWKHDSGIDKLLAEQYPFRPLREKIQFPYRFKKDEKDK